MADRRTAPRESFARVQISTAISDFLLAAACWYCVTLLMSTGRQMEAYFVSVVAAAASVGVLRFSGVTRVKALHELLSTFGGQALALFAFAFWTDNDGIEFDRTYRMIAASVIVVFFLVLFLALQIPDLVEGLQSCVGGIGLVAMIYKGAVLLWPAESGRLAIVGAGTVMMNGLAIGTQGTLLGMPRVDVFHYLLIWGIWHMTLAFMALDGFLS